MISFREYIKYAEKHLMMAEEEKYRKEYFLIPAIILSWSAIECFVNSRLDDFDSIPDGVFELHEKAFLTENQLRFVDHGEKAGQFVIKGDNYRRLADKILFLLSKVGERVDKGTSLWQDFEKLKQVRDSLVHQKKRQFKY